jgi:hypothetical protein
VSTIPILTSGLPLEMLHGFPSSAPSTVLRQNCSPPENPGSSGTVGERSTSSWAKIAHMIAPAVLDVGQAAEVLQGGLRIGATPHPELVPSRPQDRADDHALVLPGQACRIGRSDVLACLHDKLVRADPDPGRGAGRDVVGLHARAHRVFVGGKPVMRCSSAEQDQGDDGRPDDRQ